MFKLEMKTSNAAFRDETTGEADNYAEGYEAARILIDIAHNLRHGRRRGACIDTNGNIVGSWDIDKADGQ